MLRIRQEAPEGLQPSDQEVPLTDQNIDKAKGRGKEAAGALTGDKSLKNEGRVDQAKGSAKKAVDKVGDTLSGRKRARS
jgi:uncharacterized protein YjbJ (UPF0337 family)